MTVSIPLSVQDFRRVGKINRRGTVNCISLRARGIELSPTCDIGRVAGLTTVGSAFGIIDGGKLLGACARAQRRAKQHRQNSLLHRTSPRIFDGSRLQVACPLCAPCPEDYQPSHSRVSTQARPIAPPISAHRASASILFMYCVRGRGCSCVRIYQDYRRAHQRTKGRRVQHRTVLSALSTSRRSASTTSQDSPFPAKPINTFRFSPVTTRVPAGAGVPATQVRRQRRSASSSARS